MARMDKTLHKSEEYKYLGKEVAYYDGIFRLWLAIMNKIANGEDVTNLVDHLDASFPYKDKEYNEEMKRIQSELEVKFNASDKYGRPDNDRRKQAVTELTMKKYRAIIKLMYRKKVLPQEAEETWL